MRPMALTRCTFWLSCVLSIVPLAASGCLRLGYREVAGGGGGGGSVGGRDASGDAGLPQMDAAAVSSGRAGSMPADMGGTLAAGGGGAAGGAAGDKAGKAGGGASAAAGGAGSGGKAGESSAGAGAGGQVGNMDAGSEPVDAGSDASTPDSGAAGGCEAHPEALFCDGFEDPELNAWSYNIATSGAAERTTARRYAGDASLHATTTASSSSQARYAIEAYDGKTTGDIWLRYYNYLPSSTTITTHFSSGVISSLANGYEGFWLMVYADHVEIGTSNGYFAGTGKYPRDKWVCVELHVSIAQSGGVFEAFLDGVPAANSGDTNTLAAGGYTVAEVGIHYAEQNQGAVELYVDDVVVSDVRVACD